MVSLEGGRDKMKLVKTFDMNFDPDDIIRWYNLTSTSSKENIIKCIYNYALGCSEIDQIIIEGNLDLIANEIMKKIKNKERKKL